MMKRKRKCQSTPYGSADTIKEPDRGYHPARRSSGVSEKIILVMIGGIDIIVNIIIVIQGITSDTLESLQEEFQGIWNDDAGDLDDYGIIVTIIIVIQGIISDTLEPLQEQFLGIWNDDAGDLDDYGSSSPLSWLSNAWFQIPWNPSRSSSRVSEMVMQVIIGYIDTYNDCRHNHPTRVSFKFLLLNLTFSG